MSGTLPIRFQELFRLTNLGVDANSISFNTVTMESDKFICIREQVGGQGQISIVDVESKAVSKQKINADSALMHPNSRVLALKAGTTVQIFNLELRSKMKSYQTPEPVVFWKWVSVDTIALVTGGAVYHWSMEGDSAPKKVFDRRSELSGVSIINYRTDKEGKWCLLIGLGRGDDGSAKGVMQLYSMEKQQSQYIEGHAAVFCQFQPSGSSAPVTLIAIAVNKPESGKLFVMEVPGAASPSFKKLQAALTFSNPQDFPVAMQYSEKHGILFLITRAGFLYLLDVETGNLIYNNKISSETIFLSVPHAATGGMVGINKSGQVLLLHVDDSNIVQYIKNQLSNMGLAVRIAVRANLPGVDDVFVSQFNRLLQEGRIPDAVKLAIESPQGILRTQQTIEKLQQLPASPGQQPPISLYFKTLIDSRGLNAVESVEVAKMFLPKGGVAQLSKMFDENKLECSEGLGDLVRQFDRDLCLKIYVKGNVPHKVVNLLAEKGAYPQILAYCKKVGFTPDYISLLTNLIAVNPDGGVAFAKMLASQDPPLVDITAVVDVFVQRTMIQQVTDFLLDVLKGDKPEHADLQTRLLEVNLLYSPPQVADRILGAEMFTQYDKKRIAELAEKAGLFNRALENSTELRDIRRIVLNTQTLDPQFLVTYFGNLSVDESLECLNEMLRVNMRQNAQIVTQIATAYSEQLSASSLIELFEKYKCFEGLFYYLGSIIATSEEPEVHFKYIESAARIGQFQEVERITRESKFYDPVKTKDFLKETRLPDQWALINVCDKFDFVEELVKHLHSNNLLKFLEAFLLTRNPLRTPVAVGTLLDLDVREDYIKNLLSSVGNMCPVDPLVEEVEKRNRLKILLPWLEARMNEGSQEPSLHNTLAKVYVDTNRDPQKFLEENQYYDSRIVGKYCEKRDPHLAFTAFRRGQCDYELIKLANKNSMFRQEARYLVSRQEGELWAFVLSEENKHRRHLIDAVVQYALPESKDPEEVSNTVKAFMTADLPKELIELLEKIVLQGNSEFKVNKNLQNLLILTAIKADQARVKDYINRLDNYDPRDIAAVAKKSSLFEEAFIIYRKFSLHKEATQVLLEGVIDLDRAQEYAERVDDKEVWSILGRALLQHDELVGRAVESLIKAADSSVYSAVIDATERVDDYKSLVKYLKMAKGEIKDSVIDTEFAYGLAKTDALADLEEFVSAPNVAKIQQVGDRCFADEMFRAAKIFFSINSNYARLTSALVKLGDFQSAVDSARKANSTRTWKEVNFACVEAGEFRLAQMCGLNIIIHADELEELSWHYEKLGHFDQLIQMLEAGVPLERAHMGLFTELGRLYSRYTPEKLMEHIKLFWQRVNVPRLIRACEMDHHWAELRFLYGHYDEADNAIKVMIEHASSAWEHTVFKDLVVKCSNPEMYHKSVDFYLECQPSLVVDILKVLVSKIDHRRVVADVRMANALPLIRGYLESIQEKNIGPVNEALNELYIEEFDFENLRKSIDSFDDFDQIGLAKILEKHEMLEFRRISAYLYKRNGRFLQSMELSKKDNLHKDAIETAADSGDRQIAEDLLTFFVEEKLLSCFVSCLYTCYDLARPDVVMELAWRNKIIDYAMPYMIQFLREYSTKVDSLEKENAERKKKAEAEEAESAESSSVGALPQTMVPGALPVQMTGMSDMTPVGFMHTGVTYQSFQPPPNF